MLFVTLFSLVSRPFNYLCFVLIFSLVHCFTNKTRWFEPGRHLPSVASQTLGNYGHLINPEYYYLDILSDLWAIWIVLFRLFLRLFQNFYFYWPRVESRGVRVLISLPGTMLWVFQELFSDSSVFSYRNIPFLWFRHWLEVSVRRQCDWVCLTTSRFSHVLLAFFVT